MTLKKLALAAAAGTALLSAPGAFAAPHDYDRYDNYDRHDRAARSARDHRWHERDRHYHPRPEPVVYAPPRVVFQPVPYYVAQPAPAYPSQPREIYGTFPIGKTDVRVGVQF